MKVRVDIEVDLLTGNYDVRFHNLSSPGEVLDVARVAKIAHRVLDNVSVKGAAPELAVLPAFKSDVN